MCDVLVVYDKCYGPAHQVISECPELKGHENRIDQVLGKSLIQAKHYQRRKGAKEVHKNKICREMQQCYNLYQIVVGGRFSSHMCRRKKAI